jgi:hypothetical protein
VIQALAVGAGKSETEADAIAEQMSGHSLRAGFATVAAAVDMPIYRIQQHTRHKSSEMMSRYVRAKIALATRRNGRTIARLHTSRTRPRAAPVD